MATTPLAKAPRHQLPTQLTAFIGRDTEVAAVQQMLVNPDCALLTIVGPGGIGKTRLALEAARRIANPQFSDGVYFVSFAGVAAPDFMVSTIANAIGFAFAGSGDPQSQLFNYLSAKTLLLVLDNLEHLLTGVELLVALLQAAPTVKLLATSRERLAVEGEWVFDLPALIAPLPLPGGDAPIFTDLHHYPAVTLFAERAQRTDRNFALSVENGGAVAQICRLVGGMPLALELAAGWVHTLSCAEIAAEIARNLDFLAVNRRTLPERQRSVRATFDHSWRLLGADERQVLRRLAVFRSGFHREAASAVAGATLPLLASLVSKSLVRRTAEGRYDLHELVRQYAADHLSNDPQEETQTRHTHADYFLGALDDRTGLFNHQHSETCKELYHHREDLRSAWLWAAESSRYDLLQRAIPTFWHFHTRYFFMYEGETLFAQALHLLPVQPSTDAVTAACQQLVYHNLRAKLAYYQFRTGRYNEGRLLLEQAITFLRQQGEEAGLADALFHLSSLEWFAGAFDKTHQYGWEAVTLNKRLGRDWWTSNCLIGLGYAKQQQGSFTTAYNYFVEALTLIRTLGEPFTTASAMYSLSWATWDLGRVVETKTLLQEALTLATQFDDFWMIALVKARMGTIARVEQKVDDAHALLAQSLSIFESSGDTWHTTNTLNALGWVYVATSDTVTAQQMFRKALALAAKAQLTPLTLTALVGLALVQAQVTPLSLHMVVASATLLHREANQETKQSALQLQALLNTKFTSLQAEAAHMQAQQITLEKLVAMISQS